MVLTANEYCCQNKFVHFKISLWFARGTTAISKNSINNQNEHDQVEDA